MMIGLSKLQALYAEIRLRNERFERGQVLSNEEFWAEIEGCGDDEFGIDCGDCGDHEFLIN